MAFVLSLNSIACGSTLPSPDSATHAKSAYVDVPYPPPAALAEVVPEAPARTGLVWVDGDWSFRGKSYVWKRGGWFSIRSYIRYAPSVVQYEMDGRVLFAPSTWYDRNGQVTAVPSRVAPAETPPNEVTDEFRTGR